MLWDYSGEKVLNSCSYKSNLIVHIHMHGRLMLQRELNIAKSILEKNN